MSLIIDGYNLMHAAGIIGRGMGPGGLERSRLAVLNFVVESIAPAELASTTVVFDAQDAPPGLPREMLHRGIMVRFSTGYDSADELIEHLIERASAPRRLIVVSSDHRLHRAARRRKAQAIDSDIWYEQTIAARNSRQRAAKTDPQKPPAPLPASEVEYWLSKFGELPTDTHGRTTPDKNANAHANDDVKEIADEIFPQEYLDSIDENELDE
ncbi:MAG TPA: NYN domain-containing protein [Pirellulales bacterium]|jgi:hypothetical protein